MAASDLDRFIDFALTTRQKLFSSPDELVSQASLYRTTLYRDIVRGLSQEKLLQGGTEIVDYIQLAYTSSYSHFNPTQTFTYTASDSMTQIKLPWRFAKVYSVVNEFEIDFQTGGEEVVFKRVKKAKDAELQLGFFEGMEDDLWATPNVLTMESNTALGDNVGDPYSLRCFITDDGGAPTSTNGGVVGADWTTVMSASPATYPNWKNAVATFDNASNTTRRADSDTGVIAGMDDVWLSINWEAPDKMESYMSDTKTNKLKIVCNKPSMKLLVSLATTKNNVLTPRNDLGYIMGTGVVYHNIPVKYLAKLDRIDTDVAFATNNAAVASDGLGKIGYRWRFINFNHIRPVYHSKHYRRMTKWDGGAGNPFARVMLEDTAFNFWNQCRREHGIVRAA